MNTGDNTSYPLVTIVTITRNLLREKREAYAKECIESVHRQRYPSIEHLVIDGASDDGTLEFLQPYVEKGYIKVYSEPDKGIYDAMNKGLAKAKGKYVNFLNTDDFFHNPLAVRLSVEQLEKEDADYSFGNAVLKYPDGKEVVWTGDLSRLPWASHYCHQTMFVRTELLRSLGGFNLDYKVSADTEMMIHLCALDARFVVVNDELVTYRVGGYSSQCQHQSRIDHSTAFYLYIGQHVGLSQHDCFLLWDRRFFEELAPDAQLALICRVPARYGQHALIEEYVRRMQARQHSDKRYYLFGFLPVLKSRMRGNKTKYYLFGVLPLWKVKEAGCPVYAK